MDHHGVGQSGAGACGRLGRPGGDGHGERGWIRAPDGNGRLLADRCRGFDTEVGGRARRDGGRHGTTRGDPGCGRVSPWWRASGRAGRGRLDRGRVLARIGRGPRRCGSPAGTDGPTVADIDATPRANGGPCGRGPNCDRRQLCGPGDHSHRTATRDREWWPDPGVGAGP